jgi:hypothetical protein
MSDQQQPTTHLAVPAPVFQAIAKILGTLPFDQVSSVMSALHDCQPLSLQERKPGDLVFEK